MKEVIVEYRGLSDAPLQFNTGYFEQGGAGYDLTDTDFVRVWSPHATTLFARNHVITITAVETDPAK